MDGPSAGLDAKQLRPGRRRDGGGNAEIPACYVTAAFFCAFAVLFLRLFFFFLRPFFAPFDSSPSLFLLFFNPPCKDGGRGFTFWGGFSQKRARRVVSIIRMTSLASWVSTDLVDVL